jgi:hypothetical protein
MNITEKIFDAYIEYVLENDKEPNAFILAKKAKIKEEDFYQQFNSTAAIESAIWEKIFTDAQTRVEGEDVYAGYSVREKLLAFYFTWIEVLKANRTYASYSYAQRKGLDLKPTFLRDFREKFLNYAEMLIAEGRESGEIADRPIVSNNYGQLLWVQALLILDFWVKDFSTEFEKTDAFIEKSVNFAFDVIGRSALDSSFDFFKFFFQNR